MTTPSQEHFQPTAILDFDHTDIQLLIEHRQWKQLNEFDAIGKIYNFVRDDILFGYNAGDDLPASRVLSDGYGQCNTKGTLLMALLRGVGIPARFHGFTIHNKLQRGAIPNIIFPFAPSRIIHSWVEVFHDNRWINLEGYIIDRAYLIQIQRGVTASDKEFSGYGISTKRLDAPPIDWVGQDTYIQSEGIADDFGVYFQPDDFYAEFGSNLTGINYV